MPTPDEMEQSGAMPAGINPQMIQQLMQQTGGMNGGDITGIMAQLSKMSPDEMAAAISQLTGQEITPEQLAESATEWIDGAADKASGVSGDGGPTDAAAEGEGGPDQPAQPTGSAPSAPDEAEVAGDPDAEYEGMEAQAAASPEDVAQAQAPGPGSGAGGMPTAQDLAAAQQIIAGRQGGGGAMPRGGMPAGVPTGGMDAAISASMGGDIPGGPKLRAPNIGGPNMRGPASPSATPKASGGNKDMIRQMYRDAAAKERGVAQTGVKRGPRTR